MIKTIRLFYEMKILKRLMNAICIILIWFGFSGCPSCHDSNCTDVIIGYGNIQDTSYAWIPYNAVDTISLQNSNGFSDLFVSCGYVDDSQIVNYMVYDENCGDPMQECYEQFSLPIKRITFTALTINLQISFEIWKNISSNQMDESIVSDTVSDIIVISINGAQRTITQNCQSSVFQNSIEFIDSMTMNNKTYYNVYHAFIHNATPTVALDGIYYNKTEGLIGFYLTNNEEWYLE